MNVRVGQRLPAASSARHDLVPRMQTSSRQLGRLSALEWVMSSTDIISAPGCLQPRFAWNMPVSAGGLSGPSTGLPQQDDAKQ